MKINNTSLGAINVPGINGGAGGDIASLASYKVDPANDDLRSISTSEVIRARLSGGSLTITFGDMFTPAAGETAENWMDRLANGLITLIDEP